MDNESLEAYRMGEFSTLKDVQRRLFLRERRENANIPDQYYHLLEEKSFNGLKSLSSLLGEGVFRLADEYLLLKRDRVFVKPDKVNGWQKLLTYFPPLYMQAVFLHFKNPLLDLKKSSIRNYFKNILLPNFRYTALPYPFIPQLESFIKDQKGLYDLHVHLNGATETDVSWQDYLKEPDMIRAELQKGYDAHPKVKEQLEQESSLLTPTRYFHLLKAAQSLRAVFFDFIYGLNPEKYEGYNRVRLLKKLVDKKNNSVLSSSYKNPFAQLIGKEADSDFSMPVEALMHVMVNRFLQQSSNELIASLYHFYLLIVGLTNRLLVQQTHQYGFDQFQKHTLNGLREHSEKKFKQRFFQMHGNDLRNIAFLEGRISPKESVAETLIQLSDIAKGWKVLKKHIGDQLYYESILSMSPSGYVLPSLNLIAHFIKRLDSKPAKFIRYDHLRKNIWKRAKALAYVTKNHPLYHDLSISGVDAASNEFDTPPEVFGPVFRFLRRQGIRHFTYHAGEDFYHILSGVRAVYEAVSFTGLGQGDRIGHATATGISPDHWHSVMGRSIIIRRGEWLDNLIFAYHLILEEKIETLSHLLPTIANAMQETFHDVYSCTHPIKSLRDAWLARQYCPILLFADDITEAKKKFVFDDAEWGDIKAFNLDSMGKEVLEQYNNDFFREQINEPIEISTFEIFDSEAITAIQLAVLSMMHKKEIIIETLPTSNVRIGHYTDYTAYHLWNWFKFEAAGHPIPPIVAGTDDTGIFATSIYNEYANLYSHLVHNTGAGHHQAMQILERLHKNSSLYAFT